MKTTEQIKQEYVKKVIAFSEAKEEARRVEVDVNGQPKDRSKDIYVTDICVWDCYCPKKVYYDKTNKRSPPPEAVIRFTIGHVVHEIPLWDSETENGHEQPFTWNGIKCRMDEINFKDGIIVDKKTVASLPRSPKDYVVKQLNIYKLIAEENKERPTKINQLFVINMGVINGFIDVQEIPVWSNAEIKAFVERVTKEINHHLENKIPPDVMYKSKGWLCDQCQYIDVCIKDSQRGVGSQSRISMAQEEKESVGISVKAGKK